MWSPGRFLVTSNIPASGVPGYRHAYDQGAQSVTQPTVENVVWLTQEAYDRLSVELDNLRGPVRAEISRRIADAREEGDLRENGGYHAAREEQTKTEARSVQLEDMLTRAQVGETPENDGEVEPGMQVTVRFADGETE